MLRKSERERGQDRIGEKLVTDVWTGELVKGLRDGDLTDLEQKEKEMHVEQRLVQI